jgi:hypothetical protein
MLIEDKGREVNDWKSFFCIPPLPVFRERAGVRAWKKLNLLIALISFEALTLTLSRSTGRGDDARGLRDVNFTSLPSCLRAFPVEFP